MPQSALDVPDWQAPVASQQPLGQLCALHLHAPLTHSCPVKHAAQSAPPVPQSPLALPGWQFPLASQQPFGQLAASQASSSSSGEASSSSSGDASSSSSGFASSSSSVASLSSSPPRVAPLTPLPALPQASAKASKIMVEKNNTNQPLRFMFLPRVSAGPRTDSLVRERRKSYLLLRRRRFAVKLAMFPRQPPPVGGMADPAQGITGGTTGVAFGRSSNWLSEKPWNGWRGTGCG